MKRLLWKSEEDPVCDACRYPVPAELLKKANPPGGTYYPDMQFCPLCLNSLAAMAALYGNSLYHNSNAMKQSNFAANAILDQLGAFD